MVVLKVTSEKRRRIPQTTYSCPYSTNLVEGAFSEVRGKTYHDALLTSDKSGSRRLSVLFDEEPA